MDPTSEQISTYLGILFIVDNGDEYAEHSKEIVSTSHVLFQSLLERDNIAGYGAGVINRMSGHLGSIDYPVRRFESGSSPSGHMNGVVRDSQRLIGADAISPATYWTKGARDGSLLLGLHNLLSERDLRGAAQVGGLFQSFHPHAIVFVVGERDTCSAMDQSDPCSGLNVAILHQQIDTFFEKEVYVAVILLSSEASSSSYTDLAGMMGENGRLFSTESSTATEVMISLGRWLKDRMDG